MSKQIVPMCQCTLKETIDATENLYVFRREDETTLLKLTRQYKLRGNKDVLHWRESVNKQELWKLWLQVNYPCGCAHDCCGHAFNTSFKIWLDGDLIFVIIRTLYNC